MFNKYEFLIFRLLSIIADKTQNLWNKKLTDNFERNITFSKSSQLNIDRLSPNHHSPFPSPFQNVIPPPKSSLFSFSSKRLSPASSENGSGFSLKSSDSGKILSSTTETSPSPANGSLLVTPTWENIQETAARLLFMAVRWVKCLAPFQTLSLKDQVDLYFLSERKQIILSSVVLGLIFKVEFLFILRSFFCFKNLGKICSFCTCPNGPFLGILVIF